MLVLSRQIDEAVMIGESIVVTVVSIGSEIATLRVRYRDERQRVEQKCSLEIDDQLIITEEVQVVIVDIRKNKVRLGVVAPKHAAVVRREVFEQRQPTDRGKAESYDAEPLTDVQLAPGNQLLVGESIWIETRRVGGSDLFLRCRGRLIGGASDGEAFVRSDPAVIGNIIELGALIRVTVRDIGKDEIALHIEHPPHIICRKELD